MLRQTNRASKIFRAFLMVAVVAAASSQLGCYTSNVDKKVKPDPIPAGYLGSHDNPIKCDSDLGEHEYLKKLRGPDGKRVKYDKVDTEVDDKTYATIDRFIVQSSDGSVVREVFMNPNYPGAVEKRPIDGFTMK